MNVQNQHFFNNIHQMPFYFSSTDYSMQRVNVVLDIISKSSVKLSSIIVCVKMPVTQSLQSNL